LHDFFELTFALHKSKTAFYVTDKLLFGSLTIFPVDLKHWFLIL